VCSSDLAYPVLDNGLESIVLIAKELDRLTMMFFLDYTLMAIEKTFSYTLGNILSLRS